jgi:hypothetical protein
MPGDPKARLTRGKYGAETPHDESAAHVDREMVNFGMMFTIVDTLDDPEI